VPAVLLAFAVLVPAGAGAARPACARALRGTGLRLPAAVRLTTRCASYTLAPDGRIRVSAPPQAPSAGVNSMAVAGSGAPILTQGGRIAVQRDGRTVWRSHGRFQASGVFVLIAPAVVAFSYDAYALDPLSAP
jgi:hypothetical protein